jgi:hypothetical protein
LPQHDRAHKNLYWSDTFESYSALTGGLIEAEDVAKLLLRNRIGVCRCISNILALCIEVSLLRSILFPRIRNGVLESSSIANYLN